MATRWGQLAAGVFFITVPLALLLWIAVRDFGWRKIGDFFLFCAVFLSFLFMFGMGVMFLLAFVGKE